MNETTRGSGRTALVVGASRGIGLGLVERLLERGWSVIGTVRSETRTPLHELADRHAGRLTIERVDITDQEQVQALRERVSRGAPLDLLLVNAGTSHDRWETVLTSAPRPSRG